MLVLSGCAEFASSSPPLVTVAPTVPAPATLEPTRAAIATVRPTPLRTAIRPPTATARPTQTPGPVATADVRVILPTPTSIPATRRPDACPNYAGQRLLRSLPSSVLNVPVTVHIYLPPCFERSTSPMPVVYLLPGTTTNHWLDMGIFNLADAMIDQDRIKPAVLVVVEPDEAQGDSGKFIWSLSGPGSWEAVMVKDILPAIQVSYNTRKDPAGVAIGGISRGGYWSVQLGLSHPELFGRVGGHSPTLGHEFLDGVDASYSIFHNTSKPSANVKQRYMLDAGEIDGVVADGIFRLGREMKAEGLSVDVLVQPGGHEQSYWLTHAPEYLIFLAGP